MSVKRNSRALVVSRHAGGGGSYGDAGQADHFAHHAAARIGRCHQDRVQVQLAGGHYLQVSEQGVGGGVGTRQEHSQPSQHRTEERIQSSGGGARQAERTDRARIIHQIGQAEHHGDGGVGGANCFKVLPSTAKNLPTGIRSTRAEEMDASKHAVPEAASQFRLKRAA